MTRTPMHRIAGALILAAATLITGPLHAAENLKELVSEVRAQAAAEKKTLAEREASFRAALGEQEQLLADALAKVERFEAERDRLKALYDENEDKLSEMTATLEQRSGDLGELFGVFRQVAGDVQSMMFDSLTRLERPDRQARVDELASMSEVPEIGAIRELWQFILDEISISGEVSRFPHEVVRPDGERYQADVTRVGTFNAVAGSTYLNFLPENAQLVEFARQPAPHVQASATVLSDATDGPVGFYLDPSRGTLLGLLVEAPNLMERLEQGKAVGYAIVAVAIIGLLISLERLLSLSIQAAKIRKQRADMDRFDTGNPLGRVLGAYYESKHLSTEVVARKLDEAIIKDAGKFRRGLDTIKVLAAIAPLMGLLGTVTGMIGTFQAITLFGTGDPKLMAGGISQALVTTVLGLLAAIPLLLSHTLLASRAQGLTKMLAEQAAGMVATQAEKLETQKGAPAGA